MTTLVHIEEAYRLLTGEAYRIAVEDVGHKEPTPMENICVIAVELERIDAALGPRGSSMFAPMAEQIRAAYVEIVAARDILRAAGG